MPTDTTFPLAMAEIVALFMESMLFGAFSVLYAIAIWILLYRKRISSRVKLNRMLFLTSTTLWILCSAHLTIVVIRAVKGFANWGDRSPHGANDYYSIVSDPTEVAKDAVYNLTTFVADSFVTYRLWIVWNRTWWILIVPSILLLGTAVVGIGVCVEIARTAIGDAIFAPNLQPWIRSFFAISLATTLFATVFIAARLMWADRQSSEFRAMGSAASSHWKVLETIIQSAAIYSAALVSSIGTYLAGSNAHYVCLDCVQPLIGITFTLIIIRIGLAPAVDSTVHRGAARDMHCTLQGQIRSIGGHAYPLQSLVIDMSVGRVQDTTSSDDSSHAPDRKAVVVPVPEAPRA
ncbi:hypothetical protein GY45DRAFT_432739 [Cubamyces sp. BRFM 1775]|nr:hypothetical protein GY45DRAFT_432739 [Cubamyces sp. BRFM 1775]